MSSAPALRSDLALISPWIRPGARVLDLGCGDGTLLAHLAETRQVQGYGIEIDPDNVAACVARGVDVLQIDIDAGLREFETDAFDYVVMTQALQALKRPDLTLAEILRIGQTGIVTFPNFGHWRARLSLGLGRMPMTRTLPTPWYASENIHLCTVRDFEWLAQAQRWQLLRRSLVDRDHEDGPLTRLLPNLFAEVAVYELRRGAESPA